MIVDNYQRAPIKILHFYIFQQFYFHVEIKKKMHLETKGFM